MSQSTLKPADLSSIAKELASPESAVLVGAGASAPAGLPTWKILLEQIAQDIGGAFEGAIREFLAQGRYLEAAETAKMAAFDSDKWNSYLAPYDTVGVTTSVWNFVVSLGISKIVTTNWDNISRDSFAKVWSKVAQEYVGLEEILQPLHRSYPHIVYPHGKAPRWNTIVFASSEYSKAEENERYREFWISLLTRSPVLVVGFSGHDPAFQRLLRYLREKLGIAHLLRLYVIHAATDDISRFGSQATSIPYDASKGHEPIADVLRDLREGIDAVRAERGVDRDPFKRAGVPAVYLEKREELLLALLGMDIRQHCGSETLLAFASLVRMLQRQKTCPVQSVVDESVRLMHLSAAEARNSVEHAITIGTAQGWLRHDNQQLFASDRLPVTDNAEFVMLVNAVASAAQSPILWTRNVRHDRFVKDAVLAYYAKIADATACSALGMELPAGINGETLFRALRQQGISIGDTSIERQVCRATVRVLDDPPTDKSEVCARLANFSFVTAMCSLSRGRDILAGNVDVERVYLDANVVLPAIAPGHRWHTRCAALVEQCRRRTKELSLLEGFLEELELQYETALKLVSECAKPRDFYERAFSKTYPNGFLDAYVGWVGTRIESPPDFASYCTAAGLSTSIAVRIQGLGLSIVKPDQAGKFAHLHASLVSLLQGYRHEVLATHEADQLVQLMWENEGRRLLRSRFVTAHVRLQRVAVDRLGVVAAAVVPPVAMSHLLAAVSPLEIPPDSLRELAFEGPGVMVVEMVFSVLIERWRKDSAKLQKLASEEVVELLGKILKNIWKETSDSGIDVRKRLFEVVETQVVPAIEESIDRATTDLAISPPRSDEQPREAAERMANEWSRHRGERTDSM